MRAVVISTIFTILATLFVALRIWTRFKLVHSPGKDDLLICCALLSSLLFYAFLLVERNYGLGIPRKDLPDDVIINQLHYLWLSVPFYNLSLILSKLSALFLYIRIFPGRRFLLATYITMGCLIIAGLWMVISGFVFCIPIHDFWTLDRSIHKKNCLPEGPVWYSNAAMQILSDIVIMVLPLPPVLKLQLPRKQKVGIILVFCVGIFVIATSSARVYQLSHMIDGHDLTKTNSEAAVWSSLETNISIICACLLPLYPLISRVFTLCFRPVPLHSSPAPKFQSNTTVLTGSRKPSVYDHPPHGPDGGVFFNGVFYSGPGSYTASIAKMDMNDHENEEKEDGHEAGIRVVRELRMESDSAVPTVPSPKLWAHDYSKEEDVELGEMGEGSGSSAKGTNPSIEWDLDDFEFPDYKERMNAPI
ncbi:hypothetical protein N7478_002134 [Penicillium angulare]|uniref:uncharacterized protein n=1 Tax=Penicillium angulare TaxID=116970 RepID=UPI002542531E|nr:uncharacterized protein N7478_002134 [Penicillium angulare]KAJ5289104.1 hypothetical protein N7478_002134 [Penicillium angulare]